VADLAIEAVPVGRGGRLRRAIVTRRLRAGAGRREVATGVGAHLVAPTTVVGPRVVAVEVRPARTGAAVIVVVRAVADRLRGIGEVRRGRPRVGRAGQSVVGTSDGRVARPGRVRRVTAVVVAGRRSGWPGGRRRADRRPTGLRRDAAGTCRTW
jgi:hypothetical protein